MPRKRPRKNAPAVNTKTIKYLLGGDVDNVHAEMFKLRPGQGTGNFNGRLMRFVHDFPRRLFIKFIK